MREFSQTSKLTTCISSSPAKPKPNTAVTSTQETNNKSKIADARWQRIRSSADCAKPATRNKHAACFHGGYIYVYGGRDDCKQALKDFWRYNLMTSVWQCLVYTGDQLPHLEEHTIVAHKNFLLIFGGSFDSDVFESPLWLYNIELKHMSKQITEKDADRPSCRRSHTAVIYSNNMYIFGGFTDIHGSTDELWSYCPVTELWKLHKGVQPSVKSPGPRHGHTSVVHQNALWVYGGMENLVFKAELWKWDFEMLFWARVRFSSGPSMLTGHTACVIANNMFIVGGENAGDLQEHMWTFNFDKLSWQKTMYFGMAPRSYHAMITIMPPTSDGDQTPTENNRSTSLPVLRAQKHQQVSLALNRNRPRTSPASYQYAATSNADAAITAAQPTQPRSVVFHNRISPNGSDFDDEYDGDDDSNCDTDNFYNLTINAYSVDFFSDQTPTSRRKSKRKLKRKDAVSDTQGYIVQDALYGDMVEMKLLNISTNNDNKPLLDYASGSARHRSSDFYGKLDGENPSYCDSLESLDNNPINYYQNIQHNNEKTDFNVLKEPLRPDPATMFISSFSHSDNPSLNNMPISQTENLSSSSGTNFDIFQVNAKINTISNTCAKSGIRNQNDENISSMSVNTDSINLLCPIVLHDLDLTPSMYRAGVRRSFTADDLVLVDLEGSNSPSMAGSPEKTYNSDISINENNNSSTTRPVVACQKSSNNDVNVTYSTDPGAQSVINVQAINPASPQTQHLHIPFHDIACEKTRDTTMTLSNLIPQKNYSLYTNSIDNSTRQFPCTPASNHSDETVAQTIDKHHLSCGYQGTNNTGSYSQTSDLTGMQSSGTVSSGAECQETLLTVTVYNSEQQGLDDEDGKDQSSNEYTRNVSDMFNTTYSQSSAVMIVLGGQPKDQEPFSVRNIHIYQCLIP